MCEICRQLPCHPQCPNYEPEIVTRCNICGNPIYEGDKYYELPDTVACDYCGDVYLERHETRAEVNRDAEF